MSFVIALSPLSDLRGEAFVLVHRIIELAERVGDLSSCDVQLEAINEGRIIVFLP